MDSPVATTTANDTKPPAMNVADSDFNVRKFGATGDGKTLDTDAINRAIEAASASGGGTVRLPAGRYLSASIHLKSNIALHLEAGCVIEAVSETIAKYDPREKSISSRYQDSGHSYFHDALIWGADLENVSISGPGLIYGKGLHSGLYGRAYRDTPPGSGNKAIALLRCRNVTLRDFSIWHGGWFAILATGIDNLTIDNLKLDTNRDGMDIDCCRNVRITRCSVNSPWDDGICLKSSYALGTLRATENLTISDCFITGGLVEGTLVDGTFQKSANDYSGRTGRIKFGTESNGGFKNIAITNCIFDDGRGLAIESVDGGNIEDVTISNLTMRNISNSPIFIRLGSRLRGPDNPPVGVIQRISISNIIIDGANRMGSTISGVPGHPIRDLRISNVRALHDGGGSARDATTQPSEKENAYPEPGMFGTMPSYGFFIRHAADVDFSNVKIDYARDDARPAIVLDDVSNARFSNVDAKPSTAGMLFELRGVTGFEIKDSVGIADMLRTEPSLNTKLEAQFDLKKPPATATAQ